jgi:hypothetical protein
LPPDPDDPASDTTPASEPPTEADLVRIERMIASHPPDHVIRVGDIAPLVLRLVAVVRRLRAERRDSGGKFDS